MDTNQYLSVFIDEAREHLQAMNDQLLQLEQSPEDIEIVQIIFRSAHTLKGMSATMGFEDIASLTHEMENVLDLVRNDKLSMSEPIFECLFTGNDALESMVNDIINGGTGSLDVSELIASLNAIVHGDTASAKQEAAAPSADLDEFQYSVLLQTLQAGNQIYHIDVAFRDDCVLKAARSFMVFGILENSGEVVKTTPSVEEIEQEMFDKGFSVYFISDKEASALQNEIMNVSEIESVNVHPLDEEMLQRLHAGSQEAAAAIAEPPAAAEAKAAAVKSQAAGQPAKAKPKPAGAPAASRTIRVDIERLDVLMNLLSELLIDRVRLEQLAREIHRNDLTETVEHMTRVSGDLQNIVLKLRMVQIDTVFNRFPRMIRDIAKSLDKKIDLVITGAETELDRTVIDEIGDPLVHLLRNAVDHGVESRNERLAAGKSEVGTIQLTAFHSGNHVFIEIQDDGQGINRDKVLQTAIRKNVVTQEQADKLADEEVYQLLFASGFSTADQISDISGRGVGLDVVRTKIESLGGQVSVSSNPGQGTKFSVQLPLTLSIIAAMLIRIGEEKYAIPLSSIAETAIVEKSEVRVVHGNPMLNYRGSVIPVIYLDQLLDIPVKSVALSSSMQLIVIQKGDKQAAIVVDEFIGQQEIVLKSLGQYLNNPFAVSGATILGDGQVALILETNALIK
ncbi:chemotaxis protein CheA [Paenibacillus sp. J2TS4]|uniref:chemotaxis protein CheA n=1 Tax=Paenibacillus sp. J2TS4 TaxID=2807194 RepID=UPI001B0DD75F|nr:chemotaxis protein CheA [Paenibacillus sp. J2TS4]GIP33088.1 chemotaxis protein CheA [Paenibacillus sp. J2TS4]